jgi:hypothetical protein
MGGGCGRRWPMTLTHEQIRAELHGVRDGEVEDLLWKAVLTELSTQEWARLHELAVENIRRKNRNLRARLRAAARRDVYASLGMTRNRVNGQWE